MKKINSSHCFYEQWRKLLLMMKFVWIFIMMGFVAVSAETYSQTERFDLKMENSSLKSILSEIEEQTEFYFFYNEAEINELSNISVEINQETIEEALNKILEDNGLNYEVHDRYILIKKGEESASDLNFQQQKKASGSVKDSSGQPLPGVTIIIKGTTNGTVTDFNGNFSLGNVPDDATLVFSFVGMKSQEINVAKQTTFSIVMEEDAIGIEEVVAIGYGTMRKSDLTGSVIRADIESFQNQPNISIMESLQGSVAGLNVGMPTRAGEDPTLSIRGKNSLSGATNPLIVLDGVIYRGSLIDINSSDILSVDILKDASSKAIYGSQAANGVMIITTQDGKKDRKPVFNFSSYYSFETPANTLTALDRDGYIDLVSGYAWERAFLAPDYTTPNPDFDIVPEFAFQAIADGYADGTNTPWVDLATQNAFIRNTNASMSGSSDNLSYFLSAGYTDQAAWQKNDNYSKINIRANFERKLTDWWSMGLQTFMSSADYSGIAVNLGGAYLYSPLVSPYDEQGNVILNPINIGNPLAALSYDDDDKRLNLFGNFYTEFKIPFVKGLSYRVNHSINYRTQRNHRFNPWGYSETGSAYKYNSLTKDLSLDNVISYKRTINEKHAIDATFVYGYEERSGDDTQANSGVFLNQTLGYNSLESGEADKQTTLSGAWEEVSMYQMGRLNYRYNNKYLFTATLRRDGFSGFGENNKFGLFPSTAVAWVASEEAFVADALPWLNYLKIRGSYGSSGNRTVGRYQTLAKVSTGFRYVYGNGGSPAYGQSVSTLANPNLGWETTTGINLGFDFGVLKSRLNGSFEYYDNKTEDILFNLSLPEIGGISDIASNIGEVANNGIEASLSSVNIKTNDFVWTTSIVFSKNSNSIVTILGRDDDGDGLEDDLLSDGLFIGEPIQTIYDYEVTGDLYQLGDDIPNGYHPGNNILVDVDGDGHITQEKDRRILGNREPDYRFSINNTITYKNWNLNVFLNSIQGGKNSYLSENSPNDRGTPWDKANINNSNIVEEWDYWSPSNTNAKYRGAGYSDPVKNTRYVSRSFVRLQDVSLSYNLPKKLLTNYGIKDVRLYVSGKNLLVWSNWDGLDPELGAGIAATGVTPVMKSYSVGINLTF